MKGLYPNIEKLSNIMDKAAAAYVAEENQALEHAIEKYIAAGGKKEDLCLHVGPAEDRWKELRAGDRVIVRLDGKFWENFHENP